MSYGRSSNVSLQEAFDCAFERQNGEMRISTMPISSSFNILLVEDENDIAVRVVKTMVAAKETCT